MMTTLVVLAVPAVLILALVMFRRRGRAEQPGPTIAFGPVGEEALDLDELERLHPLSVRERQLLTPENIETFDQPQIDQIYSRLTAGPIPDGPFHGSFFFSEGAEFRNMADLHGGLRGMAIDLKLDLLTRMGELLWQGKRFYLDDKVLRNIIDKEEIVATIFGVSLDDMLRDEIFGRKVGLLFPAHLYVGDSQFDSRRPSVIIDYAGNDRIDGYIDKIDRTVGSEGLKIRDEIRRVRPGFYLGRAYFGSHFGLNFTLYNKDVAVRDMPA